MLDYVIVLLEDANDFLFSVAKASHVVLLCHMEQGEITDFSDSNKIDRIPHTNAQKCVLLGTVSFQNSYAKRTVSKTTDSVSCN